MRVLLWTLLGLLGLLGLVALLGLGVWLWGRSFPEAHVARSLALIELPQDEVWSLLATPEDYPSWRSDLRSVSILQGESDASGAPLAWEEDGRFGRMRFHQLDVRPHHRLEVQLVDVPGVEGGWTYEISPFPSSHVPLDGQATIPTSVTITERGRVANPFMRAMSQGLIGPHAGMDAMLRDLAAVAGHEVQPMHLPAP